MATYGNRYYLGLDMGTNSVGWAVTDENYQLRRAKGKDLWGSRLFDEAETSAQRRSFRCARRRIQRERARIATLMSYFADEIDKVDPGLYGRLEESKYHLEDRSENNRQKYALFADKDYTDQDYYKDYPTIFHLRKELIENNKGSYDVRLVFLALLNMFKHRGNFLNESLSDSEGEMDINAAWGELCASAEQFDLQLGNIDVDPTEILKILGDKGSSKTIISNRLCEYLGLEKKQKAERELVNLMAGRTGKLVNIYGAEILGEENKAKSLCFRASNYEEIAAEAAELVGNDYFELIESAKMVHDIGLLANIMKGEKYLTIARVAAYEKHQADLRLLKKVLKKYDETAYNDMFRVMKEGNYSAYVGSVNSSGVGGKVRRNEGKGRDYADLYKTIKKMLSSCPKDDPDVQKILEDVDSELFLPKQLTSANGVIPNQVYVREMRAILRNAESYLPFLKEKDESGLSVSERILQLFSFRVPYYVGPLGHQREDTKNEHAWAICNENNGRRLPGPIYPWNFEQIIDTKRTAEEFIKRMVRHCTYLNGETCLPKGSLLYEKYMVLNEINNLRIHGDKISVQTKQDLFDTLYKNGDKVTTKKLLGYFVQNGLVDKDDTGSISGMDFEGGPKARLSSIGKFRGVFGDDVLLDHNQAMIEKIIFWITIYGNDRKFVRERIEEEYPGVFTDQQMKRMLGFKFSDWGRLSKGFLEMRGVSKKDGMERSILQALWETNDNLMALLSEEYTYRDELNAQISGLEKPLAEWDSEDLDEMYLSAPVKRMVWQTMKIMKELVEVTGHEPDRIFVEMPREEGEKTRTASRKKKLSNLYAALKTEDKSWQQEIEARNESDFRIKKLYLYYVQRGRCMYTGEVIDLDQLMKGNTTYDIDHIYPRHFVKDDSIENNLVLVKKTVNNHKQDVFPLEPSMQSERYAFWKSLQESGFITKEKFDRLTRKTVFTEEEKAAFISRQLVETRQGTKAITQVVQSAFPNAKVVFSKAGLVSDFRKKYDMIKVRSVNDLHHAKDAYLNIVVGNAYYVKFTDSPLRYIQEAERHSDNKLYQYNMDKIFERDIIRGNEVAWIGTENQTGMIELVKKTIRKNSPLITRRAYVAHGGHSDATIVPARKSKPESYIAMSSDSRLADVTKYGGKTSIKTQCYCLVEYMVGGKKVLSLEAVPTYLGNIDELKDEKLIAYLVRALTLENKKKTVSDVQIKLKKVPFNTKIELDGFEYWLGGKTNSNIYAKNARPLCLDYTWEKYIKRLDKLAENGMNVKSDSVISSEKNCELYDLLLDKMRMVYKNKKTPILQTVECGEKQFVKLVFADQLKILREMIRWFQLDSVQINLGLIGGSEHIGLCTIGKKVGSTKEFSIINESVTGLYEHRTAIVKS